MSGWIKIYRDIAKHWIFQDAEKFKWWIDLLLLASHDDNKVLVGDKLMEVKRGQQIISLSFLAKRWNTSKRTVLRFLSLLESDGMCNRCMHQKVTILTICNYESYQEVETPKVTDNVTDKYPIGNRLVTELKNVEECKEYNNLTNACASHAREERVGWDEVRESGFVERFKAQGSAILIVRTTGKSPEEVMRLLDVYLASRQIKNLGHKDFNHFLEAFQHAIKNNKVSVPTSSAQPKEKKVISGSDIFNVYG